MAAYLDILIHRSIWNWRAIDYSTMQYAMFLVMRDIRGKTVEEIAAILPSSPTKRQESFNNERFSLHGMNGRQIHRLFARMTDYLRRNPAKHLIIKSTTSEAKKALRLNTFGPITQTATRMSSIMQANSADIAIGSAGCCCSPRASTPVTAICPTRRSGIITWSRICWHKASILSPTNATLALRGSSRRAAGLPFRAHAAFKKADLDARQESLLQLAERIWSPERLVQEAAS